MTNQEKDKWVTQYGCDKVKFADEKFICLTPCAYIMSDNKCGKYAPHERKEESND